MIGDNTPKILVAKKGYDLRNAEPVNMLINSPKNHIKVLQSGSGTVELNADNSYSASVEIYHGLGYQPSFIAWCKEVGITEWRPVNFYNPEGGNGEFYFDRIVCVTIGRGEDAVYLRFGESADYMSENPYADRTFEYCYKLFVDPEENVWYE